jgi:hypothetical protein
MAARDERVRDAAHSLHKINDESAPASTVGDKRHRELATALILLRVTASAARKAELIEKFPSPSRSPIARDRKNEVSNQNDEHESKEQIGDPKGEGRAKIGNTSRHVWE